MGVAKIERRAAVDCASGPDERVSVRGGAVRDGSEGLSEFSNWEEELRSGLGSVRYIKCW